MIETLKSGSWITRERARLWSLAVLAASLGGLVFLLATSDGLNDYQGRPLGTDFSNIYAGGTYVLDGQPGTAFDPPSQHARQQMIFGKDTPFYGWCYPPFLLFVAAALALLPYAGALFVWQASTMLLYLSMLWGVFRFSPSRESDGQTLSRDRMWLLLAVAFPAVFVNLGHGHNGFLTAALIGTALLVLDRKPIVAGILFGLMSYKPQFGVMIPLVLMVTGRWQAFFSAAATVLALVAISTLAFGADVWRMLIDALPFTREVVLEQGGTGWHKIQSVFSVGTHVGRQRCRSPMRAGRGHRRARRGAGLAVAQRCQLSAQGGSAADRLDPRHALQPRLRPDGAGAVDRVPRGRGLERGFRALGKDRAGVPLVHAADRPHRRGADPHSACAFPVMIARAAAGVAAGGGGHRRLSTLAIGGASD